MQNFEHTIDAYFKGAHVSDYTKRNLFFKALSGQQRNAIGCQKIGRTYTSMIKTFRRVCDMSKYNTFTVLMNIRMREGETIACSPTGIRVCSQRILTQTLTSSSISSSTSSRASGQYEEKNVDEITEECHKVYKRLLLNHGNKRSRTQINAIEDNSEEEEQENGEQAAVHCVNEDTSRQRKEKRARTNQEQASVAAPTNSLEPGLGVV